MKAASSNVGKSSRSFATSSSQPVRVLKVATFDGLSDPGNTWIISSGRTVFEAYHCVLNSEEGRVPNDSIPLKNRAAAVITGFFHGSVSNRTLSILWFTIND